MALFPPPDDPLRLLEAGLPGRLVEAARFVARLGQTILFRVLAGRLAGGWWLAGLGLA